MVKIDVNAILKDIGGKENIESATHCATRLRITPKDRSIIDYDGLKKIAGVLGVVDGATQVQIVIGPNVPEVYEDFLKVSELEAQDAVDENLDPELDEKQKEKNLKQDLNHKKGQTLNRIFETIANIFNPIVPALAGCGFLSAIIMICMACGASLKDPTFANFTTIAMAIFTFLPFLLADSTARVFKMNRYVALTIAAAMLAPAWTDMIAKGTSSSSFLGIPFRVINYQSSVLPIIFAIIFASFVEKFFNKLIKGPLRIILVPAFTILISTVITLWTIGPVTYWIGEVIADGINLMFDKGGWIASLVYGAIYSGMVVLGIQHGMVPVLTQMISTSGFNFISPASGSANIGQAGAAFGVWLKSKDKTLKANAASACIAACSGITEPVIYGVTVPQGKTFLYGSIGGAVGGAVAGLLRLKAYAIGGPSFLNFGMFTGGSNPLLNVCLVMFCFVISFVVAAVLTFLFWKPKEA